MASTDIGLAAPRRASALRRAASGTPASEHGPTARRRANGDRPARAEVRRQLDALPARLREIAQRYVARLRFEPFLGHRLERGLLATEAARAVYFARDSRPDDLFGARRPPRRRGNEDLAEGPRFRVVYIPIEARATEL